MTLAAHDNEIWAPDDGAPAGPAFDVTIPSATRPRDYRIARGLDGYVYHSPPCEAWQHGRRMCRHVLEAIARTECPDETFAAFARERIKGWALLLARGDAEGLGAMLADLEAHAQAATDQVAQNRRRAAYEAERAAKTPQQAVEEAVAQFGRRR